MLHAIHIFRGTQINERIEGKLHFEDLVVTNDTDL